MPPPGDYFTASQLRGGRWQPSMLSFPRKRESSISIACFWIPDQVGNDRKIFAPTALTHSIHACIAHLKSGGNDCQKQA